MMKKKRISILSRIIMMMLAAVMCMGTPVHVFADGDPIHGTEDNPAQAAITKKFVMPEGTTTPSATFTFEFEPISVDDQTTASDLATMPAIGPVAIAFTGTDTGTSAAGVKTVLKQSDNVLTGVTFPHAGVYVYEITEEQNAGYTPDANETYAYSGAKYTITFYVKNGTNGLYVASIASTITVTDGSDGTTNPGDKVDPTPQPGDPNVTGNYSQMMFTNTYSKTTGGVDPTDPDNHVLTIGNGVVGDYGDRTKYFEFDTTVNLPAGVTGAITYKAYVVNSLNEVVTSTDNTSALQTDTYGGYIEFTPGTSQTVNLKHDQKLVFTVMHVGASYVSVESAVEHYTASVAVVVDGAAAINIPNSNDNTALSTDTRLIGENENSAAFTNTYRTITPTGVVINNLPYIMVLVLAVGGLVLFVVAKSRKKSYQE